MGTLDRRRFLAVAGASGAGLAAAVAGFSGSRAWADPSFSDNPFTLGVASGDPLPDGVVLWTRLAPAPLAVDGGMPQRVVPVQWQVAEDERFRRVVRAGAEPATPELGHSVHAEVTGLQPNREYFYRFRVGNVLSSVGRTRTAPGFHDRLGGMAFAFASCQAYVAGYYTAYQHMAEEDLDLVVHLGDYIYESAGTSSIGRPHTPAQICRTLTDYRVRYSQYKCDPDLQAAHARFPWAVTWDDHEVEDNYAADKAKNGDPVDEFLARRAAAYQAFYEHLPLRRSSMPSGPYAQIYRRLRYGQLAEFNILDTRQYRSDQACGGRASAPCDEALDPSRSMLGMEQEKWLLDGLGASTATWNVLAQQIIMTLADRKPGPEVVLGMEEWDGYMPARQRLFDGVAERGVDNMVVLTGDAHRSMVSDLKLDFADSNSPTVGVEFLGTSISSGGDGVDVDALGRQWLAANPHIKFFNAKRGYVRCLLDNDQWRTDYRVVPYVTTPGAPVLTKASFVIENGRPGVQIDTVAA